MAARARPRAGQPALYGVPSPCIVENREDEVLWLPRPFEPAATLEKVETALELRLQPDAHRFYTQQYAGDMSAQFGEHRLSLLQVWSEEDFIRLQENLIGHLVTQNVSSCRQRCSRRPPNPR